MAYIYKITNDINGKIYVGKTLETIEKRFKEHISDSKKERCNKRPLYDAMNKYGVEHFHIEQIEECSCDLASEREIYWIDKLNSYHNGYNATYGGDGKSYIDYNKIMELWNKGYNNKQICDEMNIDFRTVQKVLIMNGVEEEERQKRGKEKSKKAVIMLDKNTLEELNYFSSVAEASLFLKDKEKSKHISQVCSGSRKTAYGYKWKYAE